MHRAGINLNGKSLFGSLVVIAAVMSAPQSGMARSDDPPPTGVSLAVASPTVPAGGLFQMQVSVTEPKPILKGRQGVKSAVGSAVVFATTSPISGRSSAFRTVSMCFPTPPL